MSCLRYKTYNKLSKIFESSTSNCACFGWHVNIINFFFPDMPFNNLTVFFCLSGLRFMIESSKPINTLLLRKNC